MRNKRAPGLILIAARAGRAGLLRTTALQAAAVLAFASPALLQQATAQPAPGARPVGGVVVGGSASIGQTAAQTTVNQASQRAAIDWRSFDVGRDHTVQFQQPNSAAVVLNRVVGPDPSAIAGRIAANGQVVITNQSGVVFHQGAQVEAAGLIVSAAGISTPNFMAGRMVFDIAPKRDAAVTNAGTITVKEAGLAALVAPRVANSGVIDARMGRVVLAGASTHTVDLYGDGLLSIDVTGQVREAPRGADGKPVTALVTNTGTVVADGGHVLLTAKAADGIVQNLVQAGGRLQANAAGGRAGTVVVAGVGGSVRIEGRVAADGAQAGSVLATASDRVTVAAGARVSANGSGGGGTVAIGHRTGAGTAVVEAGAVLSASGRGRGSGGRVAVLSAGATTFDGQVFARGGREGGDGGQVEVSGGTVAMSGVVDAGAPKGRVGTLLIDPTDVVISDHGGAGTVITPASIEASDADVTVQADNSIVVSSSVNLAYPNAEGLQTLTFDAGNFIRVDPGVTVAASGAVEFQTAPGGVSVLGNVTARLRLNTTGAVTQGTASVVDSDLVSGTAGSIRLDSGLNQIRRIGGLVLAATAGDLTVFTQAPLTIAAGDGVAGVRAPNGRVVTIQANTMTFVPQGEAVTISAPGGTIALRPGSVGRGVEVTSGAATDGALSIPSTALAGFDAATLVLGSASAGTVNLSATAGATADYGAGRTVSALSGVGVVETGTVAATVFSGSAPSIVLPDADNFIPTVGAVTTTGDFSLHAGGSLTVNGVISSGGNVYLSSTDTMTFAANVGGATVRLDSSNGPGLGTAGAIVQTGGVVTTGLLFGQGRSVAFGGANAVSGVGGFATDGGFALTTTTPLALSGALANATGTVRLNAGGAITEGAGAAVTTPTLAGRAVSAAFTAAGNVVGGLGDFATSGGDFALTTQLGASPSGLGAVPLTVTGPVSAPAGARVGITADQVVFARGATVVAPGGVVAFAPLTVGRAAELTVGAAAAGTLSISQAGINGITAGTLQIGPAGAIAVGRAGEAISLAGHAGTLSLVSSGAVTQGAGATVAVGSLAASAGSVVLGNANAIGAVGAVTTTGVVTVNSAQGLTVAGPVASGGAASLSTTAGLTLSGVLGAPNVTLAAGAGGIVQTGGAVTTAGTLSLTTTGAVTQTGGVVTAGLVSGTAGSLALTQGGNQIAALGPFIAAGGIAVTTGRSLVISGLIDPPDVTLTVAGDLAINNPVVAGTLTLNVTGAVTEGAGGSVQAATLQGVVGTATLNRAVFVDQLGGFAGTGGLVVSSGRPLTVTGPVTDGVSVALQGVGNTGVPALTLAGTVSAPAVTLVGVRGGSTVPGAGSGSILQSGGRVSGGTVGITADDGITQTGGGITAGDLALRGNALSVLLDSAVNQITALSLGSATGTVRVRDNQALAVTGPVSGTAQVTFDVVGGLTLGGAVTAPVVSLGATGAVVQTGGAVTAGTLVGSTGGGVALDRAGNSVSVLGAFGSVGSFSLVDGVPLTVSGAVVVGGVGPTLSLASDTIRLGTGGSLTAVGGTVALAPATVGRRCRCRVWWRGGDCRGRTRFGS